MQGMGKALVRIREGVSKVCVRNRQGLRKIVVIWRACAGVVANGCEFATAFTECTLRSMMEVLLVGHGVGLSCGARDAKNRLFWSLSVKTDGFSRHRK